MRSKRTVLLPVLGVVLVLSPVAFTQDPPDPGPGPEIIQVDCDAGESINQTLAEADNPSPLGGSCDTEVVAQSRAAAT